MAETVKALAVDGPMTHGFEGTASGLLVPKGSTEKQPYVMPGEDFRRLRRHLQFAREFGLTCMYFCAECKEPVSLKRHDQIVTEVDGPNGFPEDPGGGRVTLSCGCSVWTVR